MQNKLKAMCHGKTSPKVDDFSYVDLPPNYLDLCKLYNLGGGEYFNIFAAGLKAGYSWELKTLEGSWGLHRIINVNDWKLKRIVNNIDAKEWNLQFDIHLIPNSYTNYSQEII